MQEALTEFAQAARSTYQGRLFAEDASKGYGSSTYCREAFDVVVMNPPFGALSAGDQGLNSQSLSEKQKRPSGDLR